MIDEVQIFLNGQVVVFNSSSDRIAALAGAWNEKKEEIIAEIVAQNRHPVFKMVSVNEWANRISFEQAKSLFIGPMKIITDEVKIKKEKAKDGNHPRSMEASGNIEGQRTKVELPS